jgi:NAD(P)-dependent dehydrogenase (short-subunit alcohol dehydrogenase family)
MRVVEMFGDLVSPTGTIGVMSSGLGSVADNEQGGWEIYRGSKAALNTFMRSYAARHRKDRRSLVIIAPGWVRTAWADRTPLSKSMKAFRAWWIRS